MIKISLKGLANFMTSNASKQRKVLRDFKFPDPEGQAQAAYYAPAREAIQNCMDGPNGILQLRETMLQLRNEAKTQSERRASKLLNNSLVIGAYLRNFASLIKNHKPLPNLYLMFGKVKINVSPDLFISENGKTRVIKLDFVKQKPDKKLATIITQVLYEACVRAGIQVKPQDIEYLDVRRGDRYRGAKSKSRLSTEIYDACKNIEDIWDNIQK